MPLPRIFKAADYMLIVLDPVRRLINRPLESKHVGDSR